MYVEAAVLAGSGSFVVCYEYDFFFLPLFFTYFCVYCESVTAFFIVSLLRFIVEVSGYCFFCIYASPNLTYVVT